MFVESNKEHYIFCASLYDIKIYKWKDLENKLNKMKINGLFKSKN